MSNQSSKDRTNLCNFVFADGRRCTMPEAPDDMGLCYFHRQRYIEHLNKQRAGEEISLGLPAGVNTACDLVSTFATLFRATALGAIKPKTCSALTRLGNLMLQTHRLAKQEYESTFEDPWSDVVYDSFCFRRERGEVPPETATPDSPIYPPEPDSSDAAEADEPSESPDQAGNCVAPCLQAGILGSQDIPQDPHDQEQEQAQETEDVQEAEEPQEELQEEPPQESVESVPPRTEQKK